MFNRRNFSLALASIPLMLKPVSLFARSASDGGEPSWVPIAKALAGAYLGAVADRAMETWPPEPTNSDVISAIEASIRDMEKRVTKHIDAAIEHDRVLELQGLTYSIQLNLDRFTHIAVKDRSNYKYLLQEADLSTSRGIGESEQIGLVGIPVFTFFVSLRSYVISEFRAIDKRQTSTGNYGAELVSHAVYLEKSMSSYDQALDPEMRLGQVGCGRFKTSRGSGFQTGDYDCKFTEDGDSLKGNRSYFLNGDVRAMKKQANSLRAGRVKALTAFREAERKHVIEPMREVAKSWREYAGRLRA